ncbi:hypothetical protein HXX01_02440, partial [Candidatus Nomurabacteria bacterium]|nr:hypothetical protein [Candidatus Nomurabacteria bacterium]
ADTVRENEISVIKVALAEQNKNERENIYKQIEGTPMKKFWWFLGGTIILGVAIFGIYYFMNKKAQNNIPETLAKEETLISYDAVTSIDNFKDLSEKIVAIKNEAGSNQGSIKFISISSPNLVTKLQEKILTKELFSLLGFNAPASFIRALGDGYMIGTYTDEKPHLFIIFQVKDYNYAYAGMLEWEKTLLNDVLPLFELNTGENKLILADKKWSDLIINNKDTRVVMNENNKPMLYYLFNDKNSLIITDNENAIKEIISRLIIKNIKPL